MRRFAFARKMYAFEIVLVNTNTELSQRREIVDVADIAQVVQVVEAGCKRGHNLVPFGQTGQDRVLIVDADDPRAVRRVAGPTPGE